MFLGRFHVSPRDSDILALLVPAIGSVFLDPAMQVIDTAIVGRLGAAPLGAVGLSNLIFFFCQAFFGFLLIVTTPRVANAVAGGDPEKASLATANALWVALGCGLLLGVGLFFGGPWLVTKGFAAEAQVATLAVQHLQIRAFSAPAVMILLVVNGAFRGFRDTKTPLLAGVIQNLVNLVLDIALVGTLAWGVRGAASAISIAQCIGAAAMTGSLIRKSLLRPVDLRVLPTPAVLQEMLKPGIPLALCIASVMAMVVSATNMAAGLGTVTLAAHTIVKQIIDFCLGLLGTFSTVAQTLVAYCLGKDDKKQAREYLVRLLQMGVAFGSLLALALFLASSGLPHLFSDDARVVAMARTVIPFVALALPLAPCQTALEGALLGSFKVVWVGLRTVVSAGVAIGILKLAENAGWGLVGIWVGLMSLLACNFVADAIRITRRDSPVAARLVLDAGLSIDLDDDEPPFEVKGAEISALKEDSLRQ